MTERERDDKRNEALDALSSDGEPKTTGDPELNDLPRVAASLRGMPDPEPKERLRAELLWYLEIAKIQPGRALGGGWLPELRGWFSRTVATRRGRGVLAGSAFAAAAAALAIMFVAGVFSSPSEQVRVPGVFASPSEQVRLEVPWDATFQMTATKADAIGVDPDTEFVLVSAEDLPVDTVRALLHVEPAATLSVARQSAGHYRISAGQPLEPGKLYRFLIEDAAAGTPQVLASFAFQTKTPVGVVQTIPRDQSTGVPVNTGIELTFAQEGVQDVEGHFRIEPNVPGRFEVHKRVTVFVPQGELAPGTLYTVTVTRGLTVEDSAEVMANDFVLQFETGDIGRTGEVLRRPILNFTRKTAESATSEAPALETYTWETGEVKLSVQVYRFGGMEGFLDSLGAYEQLPAWAGVTREAFVTDTTGLEQVTTFDADLQRLNESGKSFIQFPAPLPAGFYLVRSDFNHQPIQAWLQVTDVATYVTLAQDLTLVWVNDLNTQAPLAGARVEFIGADVSGETGGDGTLTLDTPGQTVQTRPIDSGYTSTEVRGNMLVTAPDGRVAVVPLSATANYYGYYTRSGQFAGDDYWHYLSTERPIYLPSDTIHFWGIARPRENPGIRTVTVQLTSYSYVGYDYQPVVVAEMEVETNGLGTFTGELPFAGLSPDSYDLTISVDGQVIGRVYLQVQTYTKPAYQISVTPDKLAAFARDEITFSIDATFLEGSPVPGLALDYSGSAAGQLTTDHNGHAIPPSGSARAAAVAPDRFGSAALTRHFLGVLQDRGETRERQVIALYGLAALGEPVLVPLQTLLKETDFTWRERLYAGLALVEVGDDTNAGAVYQGLIDDYGESTSPTYRLRVGEDQDDILEATSLAAILAAGLGDARAPQLFDYTAENYTEDILVELEQISYLAKALPRLSSAPVRFAYTVDGERTEVALRRGESRTVQLTPEQLASLRLEPIEGAAGVASFYTAPIDPASVDVDPDVTVTRRYGTDPAALHEGELVQIILSAEFGPQALDGCYQLTDLLPSGLRPVVRPYAWGLSPGTNYPYRIDGQRVSFCVSDAPYNQGATYWARVVSTGEYKAEPALIQSMQSAQSINFSAADRMIIR